MSIATQISSYNSEHINLKKVLRVRNFFNTKRISVGDQVTLMS
jgi:hypothetical protein